MADKKETLLAWLKDAHAAEHHAIETLENQSDRTEHYPDLQAKVQQHLKESKWQAEQVEKCIHKLGGDTSSVKKGISKFMGNASALANSAAGDEVVKNVLADYSFEHFEIASYRSLIAAADELGETEIRNTCQEILEQELAMADWLEDYIPSVTSQYMAREEADHITSKR